MSNISIIIQREFNERVRKKSFIITTLLMPVLMIGLMAAPARRLRASCAGIVRRATGPLAALAAPVRQVAHNWRAAAGKMRADGKWRTARGKKHGPPPTKQLQKSARVLYNSE